MKYTLRSAVLVAIALSLLAGRAPAQLIVGNDQTGSASIYYIDVVTGAATAIYTSAGNEAKPWGMAYDGATNTLYWNNGGTLFSSPFSMTLTPTNLGPLTFNGGSTNFVGTVLRQRSALWHSQHCHRGRLHDRSGDSDRDTGIYLSRGVRLRRP